MTDIIVGIDGGGSKTLVAAAGLDGEVLRLVRGPATSPLEAGGWQAALAEQVRPFSGLAGLRGAVAALPAHGEVAEVSAAQFRLVATLLRPPQRVLNDVDARIWAPSPAGRASSSWGPARWLGTRSQRFVPHRRLGRSGGRRGGQSGSSARWWSLTDEPAGRR